MNDKLKGTITETGIDKNGHPYGRISIGSSNVKYYFNYFSVKANGYTMDDFAVDDKVSFEIRPNPKDPTRTQTYNVALLDAAKPVVQPKQDKPTQPVSSFTYKKPEGMTVPDTALKAGKPKKGAAKAAGEKSVFYMKDGSLLMTSFGKGNAAIREKTVKDDSVTSLPDSPAYTAELSAHTIDIESMRGKKGVRASVDRPLSCRSDLIGAKDGFEQLFFEKTYEDTLHIQIIYNILDIQKLLAEKIGTVVYEIDNLARTDSFEKDDFIGTLYTLSDWNQFKFDNHPGTVKHRGQFEAHFADNPSMEYFGAAFFKTEGGKTVHRTVEMPKPARVFRGLPTAKPPKNDEEKGYMYNVMRMISRMRQFSAHGDFHSSLFAPRLSCEEKTVLDDLYSSKITEINGDFAKQNTRLLSLLFEVLECRTDEEKKALAALYYDFSVRKRFKNLGFSVRTLRETILASTDAGVLKDKKYDSIRWRLYTVLDFMIFRYYYANDDKCLPIQNALRSIRIEADKAEVYAAEAMTVWEAVGSDFMDKAMNRLNEKSIAKLALSPDDAKLVADAVSENAVSTDASTFTKMIYLLTLFLDGKEINILLTGLINKFENIASLVNVANEHGEDCPFSQQFDLFAKSDEISEELRNVNSFARMAVRDAVAKKQLYKDAVKILGVEMPEDELNEYVDTILSKEKNGKDMGFRNFIASNVIESARFRYLVRYCNPEKVRKLAANEAVIRFVLEKMYDGEKDHKQIDRYIESCKCVTDDTKEAKITALTEVIMKMDFNEFKNVRQKAKPGDGKDYDDKVRYQTVISLYLTVLYHLVKNLVYVNSRYYFAFQRYESDFRAITQESRPEMIKKSYFYLTGKYIEDRRNNANERYERSKKERRDLAERNHAERIVRQLETDLAEIKECAADDDLFFVTKFRNCVEHLAVIRNADEYIADVKHFDSYFALYHYLLQRLLFDEKSIKDVSLPTDGFICLNMAEVERTHTYSKDFLKALCTPFGYNQPRYKNLTTDALFDRNIPLEKGKKDGTSKKAEKAEGTL